MRLFSRLQLVWVGAQFSQPVVSVKSVEPPLHWRSKISTVPQAVQVGREKLTFVYNCGASFPNSAVALAQTQKFSTVRSRAPLDFTSPGRMTA